MKGVPPGPDGTVSLAFHPVYHLGTASNLSIFFFLCSEQFMISKSLKGRVYLEAMSRTFDYLTIPIMYVLEYTMAFYIIHI